jgi:hypothetical protein
MRTTKSILGLIAMAIPVLYCGGLLLYFNGVNRSFGGMLGRELGPTMVGLGVIGLLFLIPLVLKIRRLFRGPGAPRSDGGGHADDAPKDEGSDFDPDAALARYMARRSSGAHGPASPHGGAGPVRARFGRREV